MLAERDQVNSSSDRGQSQVRYDIKKDKGIERELEYKIGRLARESPNNEKDPNRVKDVNGRNKVLPKEVKQ